MAFVTGTATIHLENGGDIFLMRMILNHAQSDLDRTNQVITDEKDAGYPISTIEYNNKEAVEELLTKLVEEFE